MSRSAFLPSPPLLLPRPSVSLSRHPFRPFPVRACLPTPSDIRHLQNGSDVRGVSSPLDPSQPVTLPPSTVREIIRSFVHNSSSQLSSPPRVALGRDSRISGPDLLSAGIDGALAAGAAEVADFGLATTPAMFMSTVLEGYDCACMLTASHLPPNRNGVKFFTRNGSANKKDVKEVLEGVIGRLERGEMGKGSGDGTVKEFQFLEVYKRHLIELIRKGCAAGETPLEGFKIVVDAGNGAGGFFAEVLEQLGADVVGQFLEPDGMFPNHVPNPEDKKAMQMTIETLKRVDADLGVVFDTDVDRSGVVDSNGLAINRNRLIALMAKIVLREAPGSTIVTDSVTSNGLKKFIEKNGGKHFRYRKGYKNVIDKGIELNEKGIQTELAIETSGHGAMRENYMLDDGAYLAVKIIIEMVRLRKSGDAGGIGSLLDGLETPVEEYEFRLKFIDKNNFQEYGANVVEAFAKFCEKVPGWSVEETNYEGYRVNVDEGNGKSGWLLLRQSLHDPLLALNIESDVENGIAPVAKTLVNEFFSQFPNVDVTKLAQSAASQ